MMTRSELLKRVEIQANIAKLYGRQARMELSAPEVLELAVAYLELRQELAAAKAMISSLRDDVAAITKQRDSANGKLSALKRKGVE